MTARMLYLTKRYASAYRWVCFDGLELDGPRPLSREWIDLFGRNCTATTTRPR